MFWNIVCLALINIKRKRLIFINYFVIAFFISQELFLINISTNLLRFPDFKAIQVFFYIIAFSVLFISIILLATTSTLFIRFRGQELGILRIHGVRKSDILFLSSLEIFFISLGGALAGTFCIILLILSKVLYLPYFFEGLKKLKLIKLIGLGGQTISGVVIIELIITTIIVSLLLKKDIPNLLRGSL
jgi:hypothetical protein